MITMESRRSRPSSGRALWVAATLLALLVLYFGLRASIGEREARTASHPSFSLVIGAPQPGEAMTILPARHNDTVTLRIRSDRAGEVHVHGYDQNTVLQVGGEVVLAFVAKDSGVYPIHLHEKLNAADPDSPIIHRQLAVLEVQAE